MDCEDGQSEAATSHGGRGDQKQRRSPLETSETYCPVERANLSASSPGAVLRIEHPIAQISKARRARRPAFAGTLGILPAGDSDCRGRWTLVTRIPCCRRTSDDFNASHTCGSRRSDLFSARHGRDNGARPLNQSASITAVAARIGGDIWAMRNVLRDNRGPPGTGRICFLFCDRRPVQRYRCYSAAMADSIVRCFGFVALLTAKV